MRSETERIKMSKEKIKKIVELYEDCESNIDIDKAVSKNNEYQIGIWDLCQQIKEIIERK
jgi:hypothetical protein